MELLLAKKNATRDLPGMAGSEWKQPTQALEELAHRFMDNGGVAELPLVGRTDSIDQMNAYFRALDGADTLDLRVRLVGVQGSGHYGVVVVHSDDLYHDPLFDREVAIVDRLTYTRHNVYPDVAYASGPLLVCKDSVADRIKRLENLLCSLYCGGDPASPEALVLASQLGERRSAAGFYNVLKWASKGGSRRVEACLAMAGILLHRCTKRPISSPKAITEDMLVLGLHLPGGAFEMLKKNTNKETPMILAVLLWEVLSWRCDPDLKAVVMNGMRFDGKALGYQSETLSSGYVDIAEKEDIGTYWPGVPMLTAAHNYYHSGRPRAYGWTLLDKTPNMRFCKESLEKLRVQAEEMVESAALADRYSWPHGTTNLQSRLGGAYDDTYAIDSLGPKEAALLCQGGLNHHGAITLVPEIGVHIVTRQARGRTIDWLCQQLQGTNVLLDLEFSPIIHKWPDFAPLLDHVHKMQEMSRETRRSFYMSSLTVKVHSLGDQGVKPAFLHWFLLCAEHGSAYRTSGNRNIRPIDSLQRWRIEQLLQASGRT